MNDTGSIAFIGGGNMARSLIAGLLAHGASPASLRVAEPLASVRDALHADFAVPVFADNAAAVAGASVWLLAAKPQALRAICETLAAIAGRVRPLVVSIAAGVPTSQLDGWLGGGTPIVRSMPNTPAMLGAGVTALYANAHVGAAGRERAQQMLGAVGDTVWLADEVAMDAVTAVSGSGPAYVFLLAEAMLHAARAEGLPADAARVLVLQTILGAARMLTEQDATPAELRRRVTSPGGTTEAAIETFHNGGFAHLVANAIHAATQRGRQLSASND